MSAPLISRVGEVLPPAAAPTRPAHRAAPSLARDVADLGSALRYFPDDPPGRREPTHRAPESFDAVLERELAAHAYSLPENLTVRGLA